MAKSSTQGIPVIEPILNWIMGSRNERFVKKYTQRVAAINELESQTRALTDEQIRGMVGEFRSRLDKGETAMDLLVEAFAVAREAMDRSVGIRNIFNPRFAERFDASLLSDRGRELYESIKASLAGKPMIPPTGEFLGCAEPVHPYLKAEIPVEFYEEVRKAYPLSKPPFRARPFDVQLIGGMVLYGGKISEMKTGEGKTIVAPLACYLASIEGLKIHVVTVNDYLVQRDRDWVFPYFHALGLTVGSIHPQHMQPEHVKRDMYTCDVVYGTTAEFGFDYLRDNMKRSAAEQVQKRREFAIVDEVDSILIDEARTPLIISGAAHEGAPRYDMADQLARHLVSMQKPYQQADDRVKACQRRIKGLEGDIRNSRDKSKVPELQAQLEAAKKELPGLESERSKHVQFYEVEMDRKQVHITHDGVAEAQRRANLGSFYVGENMDLPHLLTQSVRAHVVYELDRDYIVAPTENPQTGRTEPSVVIVDVNTGRPMIGRQWSDGLHQAVEAKEGVPIKQETQTVATITIQNFFKMYKRLAGMTGTADTEAQEFHDIYRLDVVSIPTNLPVVRKDHDDLMFLAGKDKWDAIVDEIKAFHDAGRPVLVGTTSVEKSETLSKMLSQKHGIKHEVLNAKQHEREANIVENAGFLGAVMIATNMAGRGTDIKLAPITREMLLDHWLRRSMASRELTVSATTEQLRENIYRKMGARELDLPKHEVEKMDFADLELRLLRLWAMKHTFADAKRIDRAGADELRALLDESGRCLLHRLDWFKTIEEMGGLHVIGTERHESRRIDNQLRGRAGRQGDRGSSRFFVSLEDDLMKLFAGDRTMRILSTLGMKEGDAIEHPMLSKSVERAQRKVEERNFQIRKNILEYDEVMEHQRQSFYGLRQRVLDGRDLRGLIMGYIRESARDAVGEYLGKTYPAKCASEYIRQTLDVTIFADRLKGLEPVEMEKRIRLEAKQEAQQIIGVTLGEYIPAEGSEVEVDFDAEGLARWAKTHFGVELDPEQVRATGQQGRRAVQDALEHAANQRIDSADLSGLSDFADKDFGARKFCEWAKTKFDIELTLDSVKAAAEKSPQDVENLVIAEAQSKYRDLEIATPVEFAMSATMQRMRQNPQVASEELIRWANQRFELNWTPQSLSVGPAKIKQNLVDASRQAIESGRMEKLVTEALAITDPDALATHLREKLNAEVPENLRRLEGQERVDKVRSAIENTYRAEMLHFERTIMIETLDELWKNHLYAMDQLRDSIGYRSFSQQDPRIEYKREGSKMFKGMTEQVRDRVTDYIFKLKLMPQVGPSVPPAPPAPARVPMAAAPAASASSGGLYTGYQPRGQAAGGPGTIAGPGLDNPGSTPTV